MTYTGTMDSTNSQFSVAPARQTVKRNKVPAIIVVILLLAIVGLSFVCFRQIKHADSLNSQLTEERLKSQKLQNTLTESEKKLAEEIEKTKSLESSLALLRQKQSAPAASLSEQAKTIQKVSQLIELPNEQPSIATVVDASKLKGQEFFANAENGDKVLIYAKAKVSILYRPSSNKIIKQSGNI
jgi:hypothetical protein